MNNKNTVANTAYPVDIPDRDQIRVDVETACNGLLDALRIERDHNTQDTAQRMARMYVDELFTGRYDEPPAITSFPNVSGDDSLHTVGPLRLVSTCSHHFLPVIGQAYIGFIADQSVLGLSKFSRIIDHYARRPQIQEEMIKQIADAIESHLEPHGLAVIVKAEHYCMKCRGVQEPGSEMVSTVWRGDFIENEKLRFEFMGHCYA